ncbi:hypothetical protein ACRAWB_05290 [Leifsonia poae]|uniref:hypothetical protein n=1 Tax=Leifsonia poae TaxID=110933 RepID=UPI003D68C026
MTSWPEQPPTGQPQAQTRRQAREFERSRRAGTAEPTPAGQIPEMTTSGQRDDDAAPTVETAAAETAVPEAAAPETGAPKAAVPAAQADERPAIPASAFAEPGVSSPSGNSFGLFRQAPDPSQPEPVTQPMAILQPADSAAPAAASSAPASATNAPAAGDSVPERTLTRRELRAMLQAQQANAQANHPAAVGEPVFPVTFTSGPESEAANGAETAAAAPAASSAAAPAEADAPSTSEKSAWPFAPLTPSSAPGASRTAEPETTVTQSSTSPFAAFGAPTAPKAETPAPAQAASAAAAPVDAEEDTSAQERRPFTPPTGHWSTAAELDDQNQPITTRNVTQSTAATTTNALILPVIPQPDVSSPLTQTGEILVTGSIDLPRGMGATGAHPDRIDSSDIDRLLDGEENEFNTSEVQPVRASRAISTHTSTRGVIAPPKKRGNALPVILMTVAGVLAVGVIGLLVAAYVLKVF